MLSMVLPWDVVRMGAGRWAPLILCRKYVCRCALLASDAVFPDQLSLSDVHPQEPGAADPLPRPVVDGIRLLSLRQPTNRSTSSL